MIRIPKRFPHNDILSLTTTPVRYDLAESIGPDLRLGGLLDEIMPSSLKDLELAYGKTEGIHELRRLIAERHDVEAEDVITTVGGMQALFLLAFILLEPGSDVVIAKPVFPNAKSVLEALRARISELQVTFEDGYHIKIDRLRAALTPETRLVSLASPQNPSGVALDESELQSILACMDEICPGAFLLLDETYREAVYGDRKPWPSFVNLDPRIVSCASLSKCHGAPGLRTGWVITRHQALRDQLYLGKFNTTISNSQVDEALAILVLAGGDAVLAPRRRHLQAGRQRTAEFVARHAALIDWVQPDAGALCCLRLKEKAFSDQAVQHFYDDLATRDTRVGLGTWFGEEARVFRLGFGLLSMDDLDEAFARLAQSLTQIGG